MLEGAKSIGAGAATIASAGAAVGIGNVFSSLIHSVSRNPSLAKLPFRPLLKEAAVEVVELFQVFQLECTFSINFLSIGRTSQTPWIRELFREKEVES